MGRKKIDEELVRFVWKRNPKYDIALLTEVEIMNPFAFNNQKPYWAEIAINLQEGALKMRVNDRSCRERVTDLLKIFRNKERASNQASGISEEEMSQMDILLTSVAKLEEAKPDKSLKTLYSTKDKAEAEAIRSGALDAVEVDDSDSSVEEHVKKKSKVSTKDEDDDVFEFESTKGRDRGQSSGSNPKKDLVGYLEKKTEKEHKLRKEEFQQSHELRKEELRIREKEMENKAKELEIMHLKAAAEIEERKKLNELLVKMITSKTSE